MTVTEATEAPTLTALSTQLAAAREEVAFRLWNYRRLVGDNDFATDFRRSTISAGQTITALISSLGQVSRALAEAEDAWNATQTHSRRLTLGAEVAPIADAAFADDPTP